MRFEFSKNDQNFHACQDVDIRRMYRNNENVLFVKCRTNADCAGILKTITLPYIATYVMEVCGYSNNKRTYLHVTDMLETKLYKKYIYLDEEKSTKMIEFTPNTLQIKIGVLMGGDSIATSSDYFIILDIFIKPKNQMDHIANDIRITRVFDTVPDMTAGLSNINIGDYVIVKSPEIDHLYIYHKTGIQYVCQIGNGIPNFWGSSINPQPGKIVPIYDNSQDALLDLTTHPDKFYEPKDNFSYSNLRDEINERIYLYLDNDGYVRWLKRPIPMKVNLIDL
jgi:hypothetical protein